MTVDMNDSFAFYKLLYFFLFAYATYQCMSACIRGCRDDNDEQQQSGEGNGGDNEAAVETQKKRCDLVRGRLDFRKILAPPAPGKAAELGPPIEPDLEMGEGGNEVPIRRAGTDPNNEEECCSICLDDYKVSDTVARLKRIPEQEAREKRCETIQEEDHNDECNHWFHEDCIMEWLQKHDECPLCRINMVQFQ